MKYLNFCFADDSLSFDVLDHKTVYTCDLPVGNDVKRSFLIWDKVDITNLYNYRNSPYKQQFLNERTFIKRCLNDYEIMILARMMGV